MASESDFERAVAFVGASKAPTSNDTKLDLYAFYKIASVSLLPSDSGISRPGLFDFAGRAKYDAWVRHGMGLQGEGLGNLRAHARAAYIEIACEKLAYDPGAAEEPETMQAGSRPAKRDEDKTADELLDEDSGSDEGTGGVGMVSVSTMRLGEDEEPAQLRNGDHGPDDVRTLAANGDLEALRALQPSQEQCNTPDEYGFTALHLATDRGHVEVVRYLLQSGADASIQDSEGATALDTARILENEKLILILEDA